jgi:8-oxo-dGTP diphosphatase
VTITVVAAIIRSAAKILITRRFNDVHLPGYWEFPGGKVEQDETLEAALEREIREELGLKIHVDDEYFTIEHTYPSRTVRLHFFNCSVLEGEPKALGVADLCWVEASELGQFQFPPADEELIQRLQGRVL